MPDTPSHDDEFAELFGKLPSPQQRATPSAAGASPQNPTAPQPSSRRAAREAAAQQPQQPEEPQEPQSPQGGGAARPARLSDEAAELFGAARAASHPGPRPTVAQSAAVPVAAGAHAADLSRNAPRSDGGDHARADAGDAAYEPHETPEPGPRRTPATLDALFSEDTAAADDRAREKRHERDRRKSRIAGWVVFGVVIAIIGGIVAGGTVVWVTYEDKIRAFMGWEEPKDYEPGQANGEAVVTIVEGDTGSSISRTLHDAGVTKTAGAFYDYLIANALNPTFHPGAYQLQLQMTSEAALEALEDPGNKLENTAQLREGLTVEQSLPLLADATGIRLKDFRASASDPSTFGVEGDSLEGWLFPATYTFNPGVTAEEVLQRLVDRTVQSLDDAGVPEDRRHEILTIASIIEREARFEDDFFKVSRVIQNRLDPANSETHGLLQMDSTAQYGYGEMHDGTVSSTAEALEDDNPWNTYKHPGLPQGPIANPGDRAIAAAMEPADGPWLYFVTVNLDTGETVFTNTYNEHLQAVEQWRAWCADNPDSGC